MKALVLCGGAPQLYLVKELKKRGIITVVADMNEKAPAVMAADKYYNVSTLDVDGIRVVAVNEKVDFIISVCADQMLLVAAQICEELGLPCYIDYQTAKNVSSKEYMKKIFINNGIPTSRYYVSNHFDLEDIREMKFPLVTKPVDSYSSRGVKKVNNIDDLKLAFQEAVDISRTKTAIIEEFVEGEELSVDIYVEDGNAKILCIRFLDKIPDCDGFIICRGRYLADFPELLEKKIQKVAQSIADAFEIKNSPMLIQMKVNEDNISVIEFCARTGGGIKYRLLPKVSEVDVVNAVIDLTLGKQPHYNVKRLKKYIFDEFLYCKPGILDHLEGFDELIKDNVIAHYDQFKSSGHEFKSIKSSGDRVAYFSIEGDTIDEIHEKYKIALKKIHAISKEGEDLIRHDIIQSVANYVDNKE